VQFEANLTSCLEAVFGRWCSGDVQIGRLSGTGVPCVTIHPRTRKKGKENILDLVNPGKTLPDFVTIRDRPGINWKDRVGNSW